MIQAPNTQYIPVQQPIQNIPQPAGAVNPAQQQVQNPNVIYNYPTTSCYAQQTPNANGKSQYNGVNIEIFNPQGQGMVPAVNMPQAQAVQQTAYQIPAQFIPAQAQTIPAMYPQPMQPSAQTTSENTVPAPQIQDTQAQPASTPVIEQPAAPNTELSPESFAGQLKTDNVEDQKNTIVKIAEAVKNDENLGPVLLDTQIFDALVDIINKDTSSLQGPTPEIIELRQKPQEELSEEDKTKASTLTPLEAAEENKRYAIYTISYMQERLNNELQKRNSQTLEMKDLPCIDTVINAAKSNPNPIVRISGIAALSHIAKPEYKDDLKTIFELAKSDENQEVQNAAAKALEKLEGNSNETKTAK